MCGICGFYSKRNISRDELIHMNDLMSHRGPDDSGVELFNTKSEYSIGLAHRRLSIIDLSVQGHQPMFSTNNEVAVVFNGEIYNYGDIKKECADYPFQSDSDTEVILAAYLKWGKECAKHLDGMFAIAIYDRQSEELILYRDRIGKKPLYYCLESGNLVFASELKPILAMPAFSRRIRHEIIPRFLIQQYICAPDTIFQDVYKLESGCMLSFKNGQVEISKYWDIIKAYNYNTSNLVTNYEQAKEELRRKLKAAVQRRLMSDVPLGALLSGGYDSSLVSALAQECLGGEPLRTFTIGFHEGDYNEADFAKEVSTHIGSRHTEYYCDEDEMVSLISELPYYYDEPFADSSEIPNMLVSMIAKKDVTVALSGDGGDEFFCGYNIYDKVRSAQKLDFLGAICNWIGTVGNIKNRFPMKVRIISNNRDSRYKTQIISPKYMEYAMNMIPDGIDYMTMRFNEDELFQEARHRNWQERRMLLDMYTYLPEDILMKVDRASMRYSLECRCPILDTEVMEYSFRIPHDFKYRNGDKKHILKDITHDYIPKSIMERPKKGFGVPLDKWMRGVLRDRLIDYSDVNFLRNQGIFNPTGTNKLVRDYLDMGDAGSGTGRNYSGLCWSFLVFQMWYEKWVVKMASVN